MVVVAWASPGQATAPGVRIGQRVIAGRARASPTRWTAHGWTYHARVDGLRPGATYGYAVTADNDANAADPFSATFTTAPEGRAPSDSPASVTSRRRPGPAAALTARTPTRWGRWRRSSRCSTWTTATSPRQPDPPGRRHGPGGTSVTTSRPRRRTGRGCRCPAVHARGGGDGEQGLAAFLARYTPPVQRRGRPWGRRGTRSGWARRCSSGLSGDDVADRARAAAPTRCPAAVSGSRPRAGRARGVRGYSGGAQTRWLESTLAAARGAMPIDWVGRGAAPVRMLVGDGGVRADLGVRREWLPLFDTYEVDLVAVGARPRVRAVLPGPRLRFRRGHRQSDEGPRLTPGGLAR